MAEMFLDNLENKFISKNIFFKKHVIFYARYVDDIIVIFKGDKAQILSFLGFLNTLHPKIIFTYELELNSTLPFLDLKLKIIDQKLHFSIFRKPTTTSHLIPYNSFHPFCHKVAAFHSFFHRLFSIPLSNVDFIEEINTIFYLAYINNYPFNIINDLYLKKRQVLSFKCYI